MSQFRFFSQKLWILSQMSDLSHVPAGCLRGPLETFYQNSTIFLQQISAVGDKRELDTSQSVFCRVPTLFTKSAKV